MENKFKNGDPVRFDWETEQIEKESEFKIPFTVSKTEPKDIYSSGLPMECWENIVTVVDVNGEVVAETEEDELVLLDAPQTIPTIEMNKYPIIDTGTEGDSGVEEFEDEDERRERRYIETHPDPRDIANDKDKLGLQWIH
jgi:hypothetical protein